MAPGAVLTCMYIPRGRRSQSIPWTLYIPRTVQLEQSSLTIGVLSTRVRWSVHTPAGWESPASRSSCKPSGREKKEREAAWTSKNDMSQLAHHLTEKFHMNSGIDAIYWLFFLNISYPMHHMLFCALVERHSPDSLSHS